MRPSCGGNVEPWTVNGTVSSIAWGLRGNTGYLFEPGVDRAGAMRVTGCHGRMNHPLPLAWSARELFSSLPTYLAHVNTLTRSCLSSSCHDYNGSPSTTCPGDATDILALWQTLRAHEAGYAEADEAARAEHVAKVCYLLDVSCLSSSSSVCRDRCREC